MKALWLIGVLCLCGCLSLGGRAPEPAPMPPQESPQMEESAREAAAVVWIDRLREVQTVADEYVARLAGVLVALHGAPARLPVTEPELKASAERAEAEVAAFHKAVDVDRIARVQAAGAPVVPAGPDWMLLTLYGVGALLMAGGVLYGALVGKKLTGAVIALGGMGIVGVARVVEVYPWVPLVVVGIALLVGALMLLDAWRDRRTFGTVVKSVEAAKATMPVEVKEQAGKVMEAVQVRGSEVEKAVKAAKEV